MSSSASNRGNPADIIDLDRYIRASVKPSRPSRHVQRCGGLVVDAGGVSHTPMLRSSSDDSYSRTPPPSTKYQKRFSHDSGLSDGSYVKRRPRNPKRYSETNRSQESSRRRDSSSSMREFKSSCHRALREQQEQIARVTELCKRLEQSKVIADEDSPKNDPRSCDSIKKKKKTEPKKEIIVESMSDSSDTTLSSQSSRDVTRNDHRSASCKTYELIIDRLNDLNRALGSRRPAASVAAPGGTSTVTVCDKVVATESRTLRTANCVDGQQFTQLNDEKSNSVKEKEGDKKRVLAVAHATVFDIVPVQNDQGNIITESVVRKSSSSDALQPHLDENLDDPIRFYAEAKRLQTLHATTKCNDLHTTPEPPQTTAGPPAPDTLCTLCRSYWQAVCNCVKHSLKP